MDKTVTLSDKDLKDILEALDCFIDQNFKITIDTYLRSQDATSILDTKLWQHYYYETRRNVYRLRCLKLKLMDI